MKNKIVKITLAIISIAVLLCILTGCESSYGEKEGLIIDKQYNPEYTTYTYTTSHIGSTIIQTPIPIKHNATYNIKIQKTENEITKECWITITENEYNNYKIGDYYN